MKTLAFVLIALIKTPGEGGTVQMDFATLAECQAMGRQIHAEFTAIPAGKTDSGKIVNPKVLWACLERPTP